MSVGRVLPLCRAAASSDPNVVEVTATGVGKAIEEAEKNALINAVQQVVGLYLDGQSLIDKEQVVYDRVLSVSGGFVSHYDVVVKPHKRFLDELFETTIKAVVQKTRVADQLAKANIITTTVDTKDAWGETITNLKSADDGRRMLEAMLPALAVKLLKARLVSADGKADEQALRPEVKIDASKGQVWCAWNIEVSYDLDSYYKDVVPRMRKILGAVCEQKGDSPINRESPQQWIESPANVWGNASINNYGGRGIAILDYPVRWLLRDSVHGDMPPKFNTQESFLLALNARTDKSRQSQAFEWFILNRDSYFSLFKKSVKPAKLITRMIGNDGQAFREAVLELKQTYLSVGDKEIRSAHNIPLNAETVPVGQGSLGRACELGNRNDYINYDNWESNMIYGLWLWVAPEFQFNQPIRPLKGNGWNTTTALSDKILLRYEISLHPDDLKQLKAIQFQFVQENN
jgi:hypothetical protein